MPLAEVIHGPLACLATDHAIVASVLAVGDPHPVAAPSHPCLHAPDDREWSCGWGRAGVGLAFTENEKEGSLKIFAGVCTSDHL